MEKTTFYELLNEAKKLGYIVASVEGSLQRGPDVTL